MKQIEVLIVNLHCVIAFASQCGNIIRNLTSDN